MKKWKADITLSFGLAEEPYYHTVDIEAGTEGEVFHLITSKPWFIYTHKFKINGKERERHYFISVKHIADICVREAEEGK